MSFLSNILGHIGAELESQRAQAQRSRRAAVRAFDSVGDTGAWASLGRDAHSADQNTLSPGTIYQLATLPQSLALKDYKGALSEANPQGDILAAERLRNLVDPIPTLGRKYMASASSIETIYNAVIQGASASTSDTFLNPIIRRAREKLDSNPLGEFVGHGEWRLVEAVPDDWCGGDPGRFSSMDIPLDGAVPQGVCLGAEANEPVLTIGGDARGPLGRATRLSACRIKYMFVGLRRSWLDLSFFKTAGWWLQGQSRGYCSSGDATHNDGVFPLVTTGMIIAQPSEFEGEWDPKDQRQITEALQKNQSIYVGPFRLTPPGQALTTVDVIGWSCDVVPLSPQTESPQPGPIT